MAPLPVTPSVPPPIHSLPLLSVEPPLLIPPSTTRQLRSESRSTKNVPLTLHLHPFASPPSLRHPQNLGTIFVQTQTATLISTWQSTLQQEKSGPPIKERSSAYLWLETYFITLLTSLPSSLFLRSSTTTRLSPPLPPSSLDSQQEPAPSSKLVRKPFESNHRRISL